MTDTQTKADFGDALLDAILPHVPFDGWTETSFAAAIADTGMEAALARALFDAYRPPGSGPGLDEAACRYLIGDHLADEMGLRPSRRWF